MTDDRATKRYRKLYARLLRLYPKAFRDRFAESMEQTFHDLFRERHAATRVRLAFTLGLFGETLAAILKEWSALIMPPRRNLVRLALITASILMVPLIGMRFSSEVNWSVIDFVIAGVLLFGTGLTFELIARRSGNVAYRVAVGLTCAAVLLLIWMNLAVGLIGSEDNPANLLYVGVLVVATVGAAIARLRPRGMSRALFATAAAQALVPAMALAIWRPPVAEGLAGLVGVVFLNAFFVLMFVASALLFHRAGNTEPKPS